MRSRLVRRLGIALGITLAIGCDAGGAQGPRGPGAQGSERASAASSASVATAAPAALEHIEVMTGGATPDQRVPMVVAIHGLGDRPEDFKEVLPSLDAPARLIFPRGFGPYHGGHSWFEFSRDDIEGLADRINTSADRLAPGIEALSRSRPTAGRPIVTGFSQGGMLSFALAVRHPRGFSAAFPIGGMLPPRGRPATKPEGAPPIFAWHGEADRTVPAKLARDTVSHLRGLGLSVDLEEAPGVAHTITPAMRAALRERVTKAVRAATEQ